MSFQIVSRVSSALPSSAGDLVGVLGGKWEKQEIPRLCFRKVQGTFGYRDFFLRGRGPKGLLQGRDRTH